MRAILFAGLSLLAGTVLKAQQELMFYQMPEYWHANALNPAFFPQDRTVQIGLPGYGLDAWNSGDITFDDFLDRDGDKLYLDFSKLIQELEPENDFIADQRLETVSLGLRLKGGFYASFAHAVRAHGVVVYPKGLPQILWEGNGGPDFLGQTVEVAPIVRGFGWHEIRLGLAKDLGKWTVGGHVNVISGLAALESDQSRRTATVFTDPDIYQLTLKADYGFWSSNIVESIDTFELGYRVKFVDDFNSADLFSNTGVSFNLGAQYRINEQLSVSASILDIGGNLSWKNNSYYFSTKGEYLYEGDIIDGKELIQGSDSIDLDDGLDTLNDIFAFSRSDGSFSSAIPTRYYAGVQYQLGADWAVNATVFHQQSSLVSQTAVGLGLRWTPLYWLSLGANYGINTRSAANVGFHLGVRPGPVQFYFASDNLLTLFQPYASPQVNVRTGLSLAFGKPRT